MQAPDPNETVPIENMDQLAQVFAAWHGERIQKLKHLLTCPEGTTFEVGSEDLELTGDKMKGFRFGVELCLMLVQNLPIALEFEDDAAAEPTH